MNCLYRELGFLGDDSEQGRRGSVGRDVGVGDGVGGSVVARAVTTILCRMERR